MPSNNSYHRHVSLMFALLAATQLTACADRLAKLEQVGKAPAMSEVANPVEKPDHKALSWPMPEAPPPSQQHANSLWQPGSRAFFRDQRAARVGDILRVNISIQDKAEVDNETQRKRDSTDNVKAPDVFGLEQKIFNGMPGKANPNSLASVTSGTDSKGTGSIKREEKINTQVAAIITQVLPNGNFVIDGKQEMRINYEIREVSVQGVVRPQDIKSDNTIDSTQIAEARITYGGRGQLSDVQQPRWGSQVIDIMSPF